MMTREEPSTSKTGQKEKNEKKSPRRKEGCIMQMELPPAGGSKRRRDWGTVLPKIEGHRKKSAPDH